jgi:hypothetical protein
VSHGPIEPEFVATMNAIAKAIDETFNGKGGKKKVGFVLLTAKFGEIDEGRVNYVSNGQRADMLTMMKELIGRFEGRVDDQGGRA